MRTALYSDHMLRIKVGTLLSFVSLSVISAPAASRSIEERGNIFVLSDDGTRTQVTSGGADSQPNLALDGTKVVFGSKSKTSQGGLYLADVHEPSAPRPLLKSPVSIKGRKFSEVL